MTGDPVPPSLNVPREEWDVDITAYAGQLKVLRDQCRDALLEGK